MENDRRIQTSQKISKRRVKRSQFNKFPTLTASNLLLSKLVDSLDLDIF